MEVGLGPGHILLDGNPASPSGKGHRNLPFFGRCLLWPNGWIPLGTEVALGPGDVVLDGESGPPTERGTTALPHFSAYFTLARASISAVAEHLFTFHISQLLSYLLTLNITITT